MNHYNQSEKETILQNPEKYSWNLLLHYVQFTQEEILKNKPYMEMREMIRFQKSITKEFLKEHFTKEIDDDITVDWNYVDKYVIS